MNSNNCCWKFEEKFATKHTKIVGKPVLSLDLNMHDTYKSAKEAFVSNMSGSSVGHINLLSLAALVCYGSLFSILSNA